MEMRNQNGFEKHFKNVSEYARRISPPIFFIFDKEGPLYELCLVEVVSPECQ